MNAFPALPPPIKHRRASAIIALFTFTALSALEENPYVEAFLAVTSYLVDKANLTGPSTFTDDLSDFTTAISTTAAANAPGGTLGLSLCSDPAWIANCANLPADQQMQQQAQCTWILEQQTPTITYTYTGDAYNEYGFTGEVNTDITQAQQPAYLHYYFAPANAPPTVPLT